MRESNILLANSQIIKVINKMVDKAIINTKVLLQSSALKVQVKIGLYKSLHSFNNLNIYRQPLLRVTYSAKDNNINSVLYAATNNHQLPDSNNLADHGREDTHKLWAKSHISCNHKELSRELMGRENNILASFIQLFKESLDVRINSLIQRVNTHELLQKVIKFLYNSNYISSSNI